MENKQTMKDQEKMATISLLMLSLVFLTAIITNFIIAVVK